MYNFIISTDSTCDFPESYVKENELIYTPLTFIIDNVEYGGKNMPILSEKEFYAKMRAGSMPKTSQITPTDAFDTLEPYAKEGTPVLHISFSSALSGTYNSFVVAVEDLKEKYPQTNIKVIDSLSASLGEGLYVDYAIRLKKEGKTLEEAYQLLEENKQHFCHFFTVDDLFHLHRGGRVSKLTAIVGSFLGIKPVLHVDNQGRLISIGKVRGRKASLDFLVKATLTKIIKEKTPHFYVSHGDCIEDATYVAEAIKAQTGIEDYMINMVGSVIGSHSGCGTVAIFFWGEDRDPVL